MRGGARCGGCVQLLSMMPMLGQLNSGGSNGAMDKEGQAKFRRFETIMDSMREKELDATDVRKVFTEPVIRRVARGSGSSLVRPVPAPHVAVAGVLCGASELRCRGRSGARGACRRRWWRC